MVELAGASTSAALLPDSLAAFGPAALAAVVVAGYLVVGEPVLGAVLHRRFEGRLRSRPQARRSFYRRLLVLEWGLALLAAVVAVAANDVSGAQVGLAWPRRWPGPVTAAALLVVVGFVLLSTRALRSGALVPAPRPTPGPAPRPGERRHAEPSGSATLALLPRSPAERRLFALVGLSAGICEEWLYRGFLLAVVGALTGGLPPLALALLAGAAFGLAHAYQGWPGILTTGVLGGVLAALYLQTGSLLPPALLHAAIDLRFLLVPASALPASPRLARPAS